MIIGFISVWSATFVRSSLVFGIDLFLFIETFLILLLGVLLGLIGVHEFIIKNTSIIADFINVILSDSFLMAQQLLQQLLLIKQLNRNGIFFLVVFAVRFD